MSRVLYASRKFNDCDGKWSVFHMRLVFSVDTWKNQVKSMEMGASISQKHSSTSITYSDYSGLIFGYDSGDLDKKIPTLGYVFQECKDIFGKFGQVQDEVFCGGQSVVHLNKGQAYQNGTSASVYLTGY